MAGLQLYRPTLVIARSASDVAIFLERIATTSVRTGLAMTVERSVKYQFSHNPHRFAEPPERGHEALVPPFRGVPSLRGGGLWQVCNSTVLCVGDGVLDVPHAGSIHSAYRRDVQRPSPTGTFAFTHVIVMKNP